MAGDNNRLQVAVNDGNGFLPCGADVVPSNSARLGKWNRVSVDLSEFKGKCVQVALQVITVNAGNEVFDNMTVAEAPAHDLEIDLDMNTAVAAIGDMVPMSVNVTNYGTNDASGYTIDIFVNKVPVETLNGAPLKRGESRSYKYNYTVGPDADESLDVYAVVNHAPDTEIANNTSNHATVAVDRPIFPAVEKINGYVKDGKVMLEWDTPDFEGTRNQVIEDFEAYDSFATMTQGNKGEWVFLDRDGGGQGGFQTHEIPNVPIGKPGSFFIFDSSHKDFAGDNAYNAVSGDKYLAAIYNSDKKANDDWLSLPNFAAKSRL